MFFDFNYVNAFGLEYNAPPPVKKAALQGRGGRQSAQPAYISEDLN